MNQSPDLSHKILIVDDLPDNLRLLSKTLTKQGYKVRCAKNGAMALMGARSDIPNLILLDINMPDMSGYQVCEQLKADETTRSIPVIFLSAQDDIEDKVKAFTTGGIDFIGKPFQIEEVLARVKNQLALQAAYREIHILNSQLEQRVKERTSELESANLSLKQEISQRQIVEEKLRYDALHDSLTNLPNRNLLLKRIDNCLQQNPTKHNKQFAILLIDLDRFSIINDSLGHLIGDELLVACAQRLQKCLTLQTTPARLGGDEFAILIEQITGVNDTLQVAKNILQEFETPFAIASRQINITVSMGIAIDTGKYSQSIELLRDADTALSQAKKLGKAKYEVFDPKMYVQAVRRLELESELRQAILQQQLILHYQPIFCINSLELVGFEALVRWQHPQRGIIPSDEFIPLAEETGLIVPLGNWVLYEACRQLKSWQDKFPAAQSLSVGVNVAGKQLYSSDFLDTVDSIMAQTQVDAGYLKLEITESMLIKNTERVIEVLAKIRQRNIQLCIDDFGTGYSSLSYLPKFPVNILKIDRSFIIAIDNGKQNYEVVQAVVTLAKALNMKVVAEGIETEAQLNNLQSLAVPLGQGFLFSKPLTVELAQEMIVAQSSVISN
ncbi:Diguanylate cyclase (GGDEF) domain-containing protein [Hyella patelloides LEGE 07179]|uniref:Diguanylate cyclase (GGDEF) domain-containing protein n=1 Tax=Hyella patelloides LEGE 07179 TaxID=945734 RepID=A0A563VJN8_9CYAN|nr:GGDEF domain-containing response regulator [Hyella patelloides]VEP11537.1 Diguanylate cyclase (GGDEF) domain-containing protein [Hyella patelloides LEGE 07179]